MGAWHDIGKLAMQQDGAVGLQQLRDAGLTYDQIKHACRSGRLHRRHRGAFFLGSEIPTRHGRIWAAYLSVGGDVFVDGLTALELLSLRDRSGDVIHLAATTRHRSRGLVKLHTAPRVEVGHLWHRRGMRVAAPSLALLTAAPLLEHDALQVVLANAVAKRKTSLLRLDQIVTDFPRHPGVPLLAAVVAAERDDPGEGRTHGEMEATALALIRELPDLPAYVRNERLELPGGQVVVPDLWFPGPRVWVELDSRTWHQRRRTMDADRRKDQRAAALGIVIFRITWQQLLYEWRAVSADLLTVLARRPPHEEGRM